jgi:hypothetical protein
MNVFITMKLTVLKGLLCFSLLLSTGCAQKGATSDAALIGKTSKPIGASNEILKVYPLRMWRIAK